jgi:hypothetical protein
MSTIPIIIEESVDSESETLGVLSRGTLTKYVDTAKLRESLSDFSEKISSILLDIKAVGEFRLKEVQLSVEINAEGGIALIGHTKAGIKGAIDLTFSL